jgi:peptide/nickel transport system permease protein
MVGAALPPVAPSASPAGGWRRAVLGGVAGQLGFTLLLIGAAVAIFGPFVAPFSPTALAGLPLDPPSSAHWLGTDQLGRDVLSRVLHGGRSVLVLAALAVVVTFAIGGPLGMLAGYRGGALDMVLSRIADVMMAIPPLILVLIFLFVVGSSDLSLVLLTGLVTAPRVYRIVRGATQGVAEQDFVLAARARGESAAAIISRELLPNVSGPLLTEAAIRLNFSIMFIATLNFLGLGVQPPSSDWGLMVSEGRVYLGQAPLISVTPALAIAVLTIGINLVSDQIGAYLSRNASGHGDL